MLKRIGAEESGEFKAVASGTLPSGKPVVVNADGTVSVVAETTVAQSAGTPVTFNSGSPRVTNIAYDTNTDRVVIVYRDDGNSGHGTAIVGTVSGTSISFGSEVVFEAAETKFPTVSYDTNAQKVLVTYQDEGGSNYGTAIVGTVDPSDNSISFGSPVIYKSGATNDQASVYDPDSQKVIISFGMGSGLQAAVATISGTSVSFGSLASFGGTNDKGLAMAYDTNADKVVISYRDGSNGDGQSVVGTVSGTSISFGSEVTFESSSIDEYQDIAYDASAQKVVIAYLAAGDVGKAIVGTVSGTSISYGTAATYDTVASDHNAIAYDPTAESVAIFYRDTTPFHGKAVSGKVSGTSITFTDQITFQSGRAERIAAVYDPDAAKVIVSYFDYDASTGDAVVTTTGFTSQNLTSENYIGMSSGNVTYDSATQAVGTAVVMNSGSTTGFAAAFDSSTGKVVVAFSDGTDGQKGKAIVGTVDPSNNSISFGSEVVFQNSEITGDQMDCVFDSNANKVVICYTDTNNPSTNSRTGTAIVGTVSGTSISFGTKAAFESGNTQYIAATFDSNLNKVVVAYRDTAHSARGKAIVGTVSGTDITFGSEADFSTANEVEYISATFDSNSNKVVISWSDKGNNSNAGTAIVGTVSGTSISFGSAVVFEAPITKDISSTFDTVNNKVIITYKDQGNSSYGTAIVGTVSGTSISFGTAVVFASAETEYTSVIYDANAEKILILFKDGANSNRPTIIVGTVSGTSISFGTEVVVMDVEGVTINPGVAFDSTNKKVVLSYIDTTGSDNGMAQVVQLAYDNTTRVNTADGNRTSINIIGSVIDNQNSLTAGQQYFVQTDGTIGTTAATPSVLAGTAISATELLVKT